ncbi:tumor necrosis factor receptor superfamily member 18 [Colossoma macropomum]|uniref:tumor necrosis factor receptor superfamily member 18 n=1 Tax=Colossoma macropomum TaxID=42526 RepID=UPI001864AFE0|nr:tumor necrosis factor receptor superfamily member 18 [Colossoma macropomum]
MDSVKLGLKLFAVGCFLSMCLAVDCNWKTHYEYNGKCCLACPAGKYHKEPCSSHCEECTKNASNTRCACSDNPLCSDDHCSECGPRLRCKRGEELRRIGAFSFTYVCKPCPDNMYSDAEDSMCEPIVNCRKLGLGELFPGNRTHNARCGWQDSDQLTHKVIVVCLAINGLICLALLINACIRRSTDRRKKYRRRSTARTLVVPSEECTCKLSKEEMGDECDSDVSDISTSKPEV